MVRKNRGFTLVELLVTISIVGILSSMAVYSFRNVSLSSNTTGSINRLNFLASKISQIAVVDGRNSRLIFTDTSTGLKLELDKTDPSGTLGSFKKINEIVLPGIHPIALTKFSSIKIPCTNRTVPVSAFLETEKNGIAVCFDKNKTPADNTAVFDKTGIPINIHGGSMSCMGFVVLTDEKHPNRILYGLLIGQTGNIMVCKKSKDGYWIR